VDICLIQVPFMAGDGDHPAAEGPGRYLRAGAERLLAGSGVRVMSLRAEVPAGTQVGVDVPSASRAVNQQVRPLVQAAAAGGQLPVVLAGSCDVCMGVLAGLERDRCGMVWIDAHADFNTPESSVSGFFPGMSLAIATGHCHQRLWASIGNSTPVPEDATVLVGVRNLSPPAETDRLRQSNIRTVPWHKGTPAGDLDLELDRLVGRVEEVYLHIDNDAFDPRTAPGVVDEPVPGGLSMSDMEHAVAAVASRLRIAAVTLATYTPRNDRGNRTLNAGLRILELLGHYAAATR
jgi:arginase